MDEIAFYASLLRDLRAIELIDRLIDEGALAEGKYRQIFMHMIDGCDDMLKLDASSEMNGEWAFLIHLRDFDRFHAERWRRRSGRRAPAGPGPRRRPAAWCCGAQR